MSRLLREYRRRRAGVGGQSGFALLATLVIILTTSVLVMAVLGLSFTSTAFSAQQVARDRATRDADAAMETAVNVLRHEGKDLGTPATGCAELFPLDADNLPVVQGESGDVVVDCEALTPDVPYIPTDAQLNDQGVFLTGDDYGSAHGTIDPTSFPWSDALGPADAATASGVASGDAALVASGSSALPFTNPVTVRSGAAVLRDPVIGQTGQNGPALTVGAGYAQGDVGILGSAGATCGVLSPTSLAPATQIASRPSAPQCDDAAGKQLTADDAQDAAEDNSWPLEKRVAQDRSSQIIADCNSLPSSGDAATRVRRQGDLISFPPGAYDVGALNRWLRSGNCDGKVFWFQPGTYWLGCGPSQPTTTSCDAANGDALRINDASSVVVFGAENAWGTPTLARVRATFPRACNPDAVGVAITLQSRTAIRHDAGQVAICDRITAGKPMTTAAIYQPKKLTPNWPASGDNPPSSSTSPAVSIGGYDPVTFYDLGNLAGPGSATATANCPQTITRLIWVGWFPELRDYKLCKNSGAAVQVGSWATPVPNVTGDDNPITAVQLRIVGSGASINSGSQLNLALTDASGLALCNLSVDGDKLTVPEDGGSFTFDITVDLSSSCRNIRNLQDLNGIGAQVEAQIVPRCVVNVLFGISDITNRNKCELDNLPRISLDLISLSAKGTDEGAVGSAFRITSDASSTPAFEAAPASFNVYGQVSAPLADLDLYWNGTPLQSGGGVSDPLFSGTIYFNGMGSRVGPSGSTGIVCCGAGVASERRVQLRAWTDVSGGSGVLSGTAVVTIQDWRPADDAELDDAGIDASDEDRVVISPGYRSRTESWGLCASMRTTYSSVGGLCRAPA